MRKLAKIIVLLAVFLGGYYVGHRPGSPDIFARAGQIYNRLTSTKDDISARAKQNDVPVTKAAISYLLESTPEAFPEQACRSSRRH
ncbi:MAG: hypothetical protein SVV80_10400 [Planctomycetota bacterium]|nr:hypothetical protein [Planctomycetota bacterium]